MANRFICVHPASNVGRLFAYTVASNPDEVLVGAKSAYYPVELSQVIRTVLQEAGRYAIIGFPYTLKSIRLAMLADKRLRGRIAVLAGLVCGQTKSRAFAEYLIQSEGIDLTQVRSLFFPGKRRQSSRIQFLCKGYWF